MPLPRAALREKVSSTAKVMYARLMDKILTDGIEGSNGILFTHFPIVEMMAAFFKSMETCKRSLNEMEQVGMILRIGVANHIYVLIQKRMAGMIETFEKLDREFWKESKQNCGGHSIRKKS